MGILEQFALCIDAVRHGSPVTVAPKLYNWQRLDRDSDNWDKVGHCGEMLNALNGHPSQRSLIESIDWWGWLLSQTSLERDETNSRTYSPVLFPTEVVVASLAITEKRLQPLRDIAERRMLAWMGKLCPLTVRRPPREIREHRIGKAGVIYGTGMPVPGQPVHWFGMGNRSIVLNRSGGSDERTFLDRNPVNQWLGVLLGIGFKGATDSHAKQFAVAFTKSRRTLWSPSSAERAQCIAAMDGQQAALLAVSEWLDRVPLPKHLTVLGRQTNGDAWCLFPHAKEGSTQGGSGTAVVGDHDFYLTAMPGAREGKGGGDNVQPATAGIEMSHSGFRTILCWADRNPHDRYEMPLGDSPDVFRMAYGPEGRRIEAPAFAENPRPTTPPVVQPPSVSHGAPERGVGGFFAKLSEMIRNLFH